jgi:acyl carrier protein
VSLDEAAVKRRLREFVAERSGKVRPQDVADDTPILERRILTSLQVLDLILLVEELSGRALDASRLKPGVFRDVDTIYRSFFAAEGGPRVEEA